MNANADKDYIDARIDVVRSGMDGRLDAFQAEVNAQFAETNGKIDTSIAELRKDIAELGSRMVQWMVGTFIATITIFITVMTFVLNNAIPKAPAAPVPLPLPLMSAPAIIIQLTPQGATVMPAAPAVKMTP